MKETIIEIKNLKYAYTGDKPALRGIDVTIGKGERIAVIGSNGAGKSTFFLNLNGVLTPDSGGIDVRGRRLTRDQ